MIRLTVLALLLLVPLATYAQQGGVATQILSDVQQTASPVFQQIESLRRMVYESAQREIERLRNERSLKEERVRAAVDTDTDVDALLAQHARPKTEALEVRDTSGILDGLVMQTLQVGAFVFGSAFVFYPLLLLILCLIVRVLWRRVRRVA